MVEGEVFIPPLGSPSPREPSVMPLGVLARPLSMLLLDQAIHPFEAYLPIQLLHSDRIGRKCSKGRKADTDKESPDSLDEGTVV